MPDTEQNQKEYPQPGTQKKALVSLSQDTCSDMSWQRRTTRRRCNSCEGKETGEQDLLRALLSRLRPGDCLLALLLSASADRVFEKKGARCIDCRQCDGKSGSKDGVFKRKRPRQRVDEPSAL